jgi:hypothetical protein
MIINYIAPFVGVAALFLPLPLSAAPHVVSDPATYIDGKNPEERFAGIAAYCAAPIIGQVISLDSRDAWVVSADPTNVGKTEKWFTSPRPDAKPIRVPGMMQETLGEYHGVAWYWRTVNIAENPHQNGRYILRFWSIDYYADIYVNGQFVGNHEAADTMFELDITSAVKPNAENLIAVRVINPTDKDIDGFVIGQTPGRNRIANWSQGLSYNAGGIMDSADILVTSPVRVEDLYVKPNAKSGVIEVEVNVRNALDQAVKGNVVATVSAAASGETVDLASVAQDFKPGDTLVKVSVTVNDFRFWDVNDPYLYRVTARVGHGASNSVDEKSTKCGFRDFRFEDGYFRLNGKRIFIKSAHFGGEVPATSMAPFDPGLVRKDFLNLKLMGFNTARCIAGLGRRSIMDLSDEIGLMVYDENFASWCMVASPKLGERWKQATAGMIRRDRNHPCVIMWGLLNETNYGPVFTEAINSLGFVKAIDDTRVVMLNSGCFPESPAKAGKMPLPQAWTTGRDFVVPFVACNKSGSEINEDGTIYPAGMIAMHVGPSGEPAAIRFTAPADGEYLVKGAFKGIAGPPAPGPLATAAIYVVAKGEKVFTGTINCGGKGNETAYEGKVALKKGQTVEILSGSGDGAFKSDTTGIDFKMTGPDGKVYDAASSWSVANKNPNGVWTYGYVTENSQDVGKFAKFDGAFDGKRRSIGSLSNPGSKDWEDVLADKHPYQTSLNAEVINTLRTIGGGTNPLFISEYGFGSANNLFHLLGHYDQVDIKYVFDRAALNNLYAGFSGDWNRWNLADTFGNMENYFRQCIALSAEGRLIGTSAIRSNPNVVAHSLTACHDTVLVAEGLITSFREPKPGMSDAMTDAWAPLRFSVFAEPVQVYKGGSVHVEAVLVNEDVLKPGKYPVRVQVIGPDGYRALDTTFEVEITAITKRPEPPFAQLVFKQDVKIDGPAGEYAFYAFFDKGAAAEGGEYKFWVADPAAMPAVASTITLWGDDKNVAAWLASRGIKTKPFDANQTEREVILVGCAAGADFTELAKHIARGSAAVFLSPEVFGKDGNPTAMLPLKNKGGIVNSSPFLYPNNDWAKNHPAFAGLPKGVMDYQFYREILGKSFWSGQDIPDEIVSGMMNTSLGYVSGLTVCAYRFGEGKFMLSSLQLRDTLSGTTSHPIAERILRNMLVWAESGTSAPLAPLPADFDAQLKVIGYE